MGIFKSIFTHILQVPFYTRLQIFIQLSQTLMPYLARPPSEFLHFTRTLTSKHAY